ncbi:hypothetical protein ACFX2I_033662 [Malus domestica]
MCRAHSEVEDDDYAGYGLRLEKVVVGWIWTREAVACGVWRRLDVPVRLRIWRNRAGRLFSDLQEAGLQVTVRGSSSCEFYLRTKEVEASGEQWWSW